MRGRYTLHCRAEEIAERFGVHVPPTLPERFNIAPSQQVLAVRLNPEVHQRQLACLRWGLIPFWAAFPGDFSTPVTKMGCPVIYSIRVIVAPDPPVPPRTMRSILNPAVAVLFSLVITAGPRWVSANDLLWDGLFADGTRITGVPIAGWNAPASQPQLGGKPMFDAANPVRWVVQQGPLASPAAASRQPFVEFACGDRLPGLVEGHTSGLEDWRRTTPPHLLVRPLSPVDFPGKPPRAHVRVASEFVRRIVLVPRIGPPLPPATILTRDGREVGFRSLRFSGSGVIILGDDGTQRLPFDEIAEIRLADRDPWEMYVRLVAWLVPQAAASPADAASARLMRAETDDGLVATTAVDPLQGTGDVNNPRSWHLRTQPAWSLDPLWLPHANVRRRIMFAASEVPFSLIEPATFDRKATFGGSWTWESDRNVQGGPLAAKGLPFGWGFGTQASSSLTFPLPAFATAFRAGAALDDAAGGGGCVKASVHLGDAAAKPLWQSDFLVGTRDPVDTGSLAIPSAAAGAASPRTIVLVADAAHEGRPKDADVHDIRDIFDWLDPVVSLAPEGLAAAVRDRLPATIAAWRDWEVMGQPAIRTLVDPLAPPDMPGMLRQSLVVGGETVLRRRLEVSAEMTHLVVGMSRTAASPSKLAIRIDGETVAEADVPERKPGATVLPFVVPLAGFTGRGIFVEVVHRGSDDKSFVEWSALGPTGSLGTRWQTLVPASVASEGKATLKVLDDGSVLAAGPSADKDVHTLEIDTDLERITGLRLEARRDGSLPAGGPGRAANGSFVLQAVEAQATSRADPARTKPLTFSKAAATFAQGGHGPETIIDANPGSGWANGGLPKNVDPAVILSLAEPAGFAGGSRIKLVLRYQQGGQNVLGRFRLAATTDPDPQFGIPATVLEPRSPAAAAQK